jgi:hypothetical protein
MNIKIAITFLYVRTCKCHNVPHTIQQKKRRKKEILTWEICILYSKQPPQMGLTVPVD